MKRLSICIITPTFPPECASGGGIYSYEIAQRLANRNHRVQIITTIRNASCYENSNIKVHSVKSGDLFYFPFLAWQKFRKEIKEPVDILHGNHIYHWLFCLKKPKNIKKIITTSHNSYIQRFYFYSFWRKISYPPLILLEQLVYSKSSQIIAVSEFTKFFILKYFNTRDKITLIPNGVNEKIFSPKVQPENFLKEKFNLNPQTKIVLFVGRLDQNKNLFPIIKSFKLISKLNIHFIILGKGELKKKLVDLVYKLGLEKKIHFLNAIPYKKMPLVYRSADSFILLSRSEGLPLALLEAASSGLPLIASQNATGHTDIIKEGINGFVVKDRDVQNIASKIIQATNKSKEMGEKSRDIIINKYTWDKCFINTERIYQKALE